MQRFCETIENSLNIYKALAKRRQGGSVRGGGGYGARLHKRNVFFSLFFILADLFCLMLLTHLPQTVLTAPAKVFEPFRTSQQQLQLITRADLFRDEGARERGSGSGSGRETSRQNRKLQKCPIHKYLSVAAGCWLLAAGDLAER